MDGSECSRPNETILVVDDAEAVRKMVCSMLSQSGYAYIEAADGHEALQVLNSPAREVHLVLTDLVMPGMSGTELARKAAGIHPGLRFLFMSGYSEDPVVHDLARSPAIFLAKPFTVSELMDKIRCMLDQPWTGLPGMRSGSSSSTQ